MELLDAANVIVGALSAGAVAAMKDSAGQAVKDAYGGLKAEIARRFKGDAEAEMVLRKFESAPQNWQAPLTQVLVERGDADDTVLDLAERLQRLLAPQQVAGQIYNTQVGSVDTLVQGNGTVINRASSKG